VFYISQSQYFNTKVVSNSNAIGYVTNNFIGQLHLHVRVNFTFYLVRNTDLKWHTLICCLFGYDYIIDHWIFYIKCLISNRKGFYLQVFCRICYFEKVQRKWLITADNCKQMLLLGEFH
jgi:uncharacterized membrane protein YciS (DUF1049 family)